MFQPLNLEDFDSFTLNLKTVKLNSQTKVTKPIVIKLLLQI